MPELSQPAAGKEFLFDFIESEIFFDAEIWYCQNQMHLRTIQMGER